LAASSGLSKSIRDLGNAGEPQSTVEEVAPVEMVKVVDPSSVTTARPRQIAVKSKAMFLVARTMRPRRR
jgi:hypothetical protein